MRTHGPIIVYPSVVLLVPLDVFPFAPFATTEVCAVPAVVPAVLVLSCHEGVSDAFLSLLLVEFDA